MKLYKLTKFGIVSLTAIALGAVAAPVVTPATFGSSIVYAEEQNQNARTLNIMDRPTDEKGVYLPNVDLGLSKVVQVTSEKPYVVDQPEIKGWERDGVFYTKADSSVSKAMRNGDQITYDDLSEGDDGSYGGLLLYSYKRAQPASDQPAPPAEKPAEPQKPAEKPAEPQKPAEKPAAAAPKADKPAELPNTGEANNPVFIALGALLALFSFRKKAKD